jgi:Cof subfamily protein (haloacid dehalogenase superfamily)
MTKTIKLIAVDLDGTLLDNESRLSERTEQVMKQAIAQGVKVVLATGKTAYSGREIIKRLALDTPGIYVQGLAIHYPDGSDKTLATLEPDLARRFITYAEERSFDVVAYNGSRILTRKLTPAVVELAERYHDAMPEVVGPLQNQLNTLDFVKLLIIKRHDFKKVNALRYQFNLQLDGKARLVQALGDMLEVLPPGQSKGHALKVLLKEMGIKEAEVMAIGDGENDIEMVKMAGIGVAMGNAHASLKAVADHVVATNDEDGVAQAVERFVLKSTEAKPAADAKPESNDSAEKEADKS